MKFAQRTVKTSSAGLDAIFAASGPNVISFAGGYPDATLFPEHAMQAAFSESFAQHSGSLLQYSTTAGYLPLREKLADRMNRRDHLNLKADDILLTQGAQQGIDLTARLLLDKGDGVIVEGPTYIGGLAAFDAYEPTYYEVPIEEDGMDITKLQKALMQHQVKLIYTIPDFQNPTGTVMSVEKRQAMVQLANQYDVVILEDSPYRDLRYTGENLPTIKSFDTEGRVISLGSFSKILAPSLRLGWLTAAPELLAALTALKAAADVESSHLVAVAVDTFMNDNDLDAHIDAMKQVYQTKRDAMLNALERYMPKDVHFNHPDGGFFLWLTLPEGFDMQHFMTAELLPEYNVSLVPSHHLYASKSIENGARLNFTNVSEATIESGIKMLGQALNDALHPAQVNQI
ncbi:aminotransferase-like domain-containing protein [Lacticaseibacillus saniviri]|uniref:Aminotransferase n=1 Tax=Lacticaseibacillus saniviri JCM 17471 = DSM 24301 TaxID=1293598 RepID=A0A0R2MZE8_9LACO|nr:PLP-dependent aminotransferase family protein [Lacticaseibacillus saniviri]KRO18869.1 aminotransferase [Lacticaseibacillus saniviri JCM 17471 = DSM 24301]MCG4281446.1 PLP-dependent aminotransferase family protein [Lacticaseibacillus saniviri]